MADWLSGISPDDIVRVEIVRVTVTGRPSCVTDAEFRVHLSDGSWLLRSSHFTGKMYETLVDDVAALNAWVRRRRMR